MNFPAFQSGYLTRPERALGSLLDRFFAAPFFGPRGANDPERMPWTPVNIAERENVYIVELEIPGMEPEDIDVQVMGDQLVVSGEKRLERSEEQGTWQAIECQYGAFQRSIPLPQNLDTRNIDAVYRRGVLTLTIPKTRPSRPNTIEVRREEGDGAPRESRAAGREAKSAEASGKGGDGSA